MDASESSTARRAAPEADAPDADVAPRAIDRRRELTALMRDHGDAVYRFVRQLVRDDALADDVHQQVFIEAYRDLDRFEGRAAARTWLFAIARHRCLDALKAERRRAGRRAEEDEAAGATDAAPPPSERLDRARLAVALEECLGELAPAVRTAVLLRYQEGFSYEDMARICRDKPGTLGQRVARALPVLRRCVERRTGGTP
jgi:RNA polymerase sigma factor (sigma-70 family)